MSRPGHREASEELFRYHLSPAVLCQLREWPGQSQGPVPTWDLSPALACEGGNPGPGKAGGCGRELARRQQWGLDEGGGVQQLRSF